MQNKYKNDMKISLPKNLGFFLRKKGQEFFCLNYLIFKKFK